MTDGRGGMNLQRPGGKELPGDRNLRELVQAALFIEHMPCQRRYGTTCPCGPCSARRVLKRLRRSAIAADAIAKLKKKQFRRR